ncbi:mandelate racemase/muconate lactonizing enzyme family protein [Roseitranquillus sediminis]|uniref:mandelate racemase/muconate lactonizing enzyme family protein n=1 Tax=Roseitranquillus sediminis TaxID=2809051 RepID=UPI001D0CD912|nr:mandelate racemase/muconate lactonizing enzyme family protein [Roseitranquillus sediminis]MBM9593482.1 mandelate racemase/muconate lactonizing enzyme family protein [Roseitranquillus sediminis]
MRVDSIECIEIVGRLREPWLIASGPITELGALVVRITDEQGRCGYGECCSRGGIAVLRAVVEDLLAPIVHGRETADIGAIWRDMLATLRTRGHTRGFLLEAMSGIDIALWDLAGQQQDRSISSLLFGHGRKQVRAYASSILIDAPDAMAAEAARLRDEGYDAIKMKIAGDVDADVERVASVRAALGPEVRLMLDANSGFDAPGAIEFARRTADQGVYWLEEPLPLDDLPGYRRLRAASGVRIALGEGEFTAGGFREFLRDGLIDVLQPNVTRAGGVTGVRQITGLATAYNLAVAPHTGASGPVCMAATLQLAGAIDGFLMHEFMYLEDPFEHVFESGLPVPSSGRIEIPREPGLGCTIDPSVLDDLTRSDGRAAA